MGGTINFSELVHAADPSPEKNPAYEFPNGRTFYESSVNPFSGLDIHTDGYVVVTSEQAHQDIVTADADHDIILTSGYGDVVPQDPNAITDGYGEGIRDGIDRDITDGNE